MSIVESTKNKLVEEKETRFETSIDYEKSQYKTARRSGEESPPHGPGSTFEEITPAIGTEVRGLQLSDLNSQQRDELALLAAERGVVIFRGQDFADIGPDQQREFGAHFGPLHVHQHGGQIKGYPELLPVYRDFKSGAVDNEIKNNVSSIKWGNETIHAPDHAPGRAAVF